MIRLLKFQARFGFHIDPKCQKALHTCKEEVLKSSPERLIEEIFLMLESKAAAPFFKLLHESGFLEIIFPCFSHFFSSHLSSISYSYLKEVDKLQTLSRPQLLAALVFPILEEEIQYLIKQQKSPLSHMMITELSRSLLHGINTSSFAHFPKKILLDTHTLLCNQFHLTPLKGPPRYTRRFSSKSTFMHALAFLKIRSNISHKLQSIYRNWKAHT